MINCGAQHARGQSSRVSKWARMAWEERRRWTTTTTSVMAMFGGEISVDVVVWSLRFNGDTVDRRRRPTIRGTWRVSGGAIDGRRRTRRPTDRSTGLGDVALLLRLPLNTDPFQTAIDRPTDGGDDAMFSNGENLLETIILRVKTSNI